LGDNIHVDQSDRRQQAAWRARLGIAIGLIVVFVALTVLGLARADWIFAGILVPFAAIAVARVWLMFASRQPVSYLSAVVILLTGPREFIAKSGLRRTDAS
jgi:hypothetical protein